LELYGRIAKITASYRKSGSGNTIDGDVRSLTGSRNMAVSRMRNEKYANWPLRLAESPKFLHLIGNRSGSGNTSVTSDF